VSALRILVHALNYAPELTGSGRYTGEMAAWLAGRGHAVTVIAAPPHYPAWRIDPAWRGRGYLRERIEGVDVVRVPVRLPRGERVTAGGRIALETSFTLASLPPWLRLLAGRRFDAVIAVCPPMQAGVLPWLYGVLRRVPWVFHVQDLQVDAALRLGMLDSGFGRALYGIERFLLRRATRVSTITPAMRRRIADKAISDERLWLLPNWADLDRVRPLPAGNAFRGELRVAEDAVVVMYSGAMGEKQGLDVVLRAARQLRDEARIRFVLVGADRPRAPLERRAAEMGLGNVTFLPLQPADRLPEMLAAGDIHLVVQRAEAADLVMPSKLTNILAAGRPAIATAAPGSALHEAVEGHGTGVVTPPDDDASLAAAILDLAASAERRRQMGQNAREYAEETLDRDRILARFEGQLEKLTGKP